MFGLLLFKKRTVCREEYNSISLMIISFVEPSIYFVIRIFFYLEAFFSWKLSLLSRNSENGFKRFCSKEFSSIVSPWWQLNRKTSTFCFSSFVESRKLLDLRIGITSSHGQKFQISLSYCKLLFSKFCLCTIMTL